MFFPPFEPLRSGDHRRWGFFHAVEFPLTRHMPFWWMGMDVDGMWRAKTPHLVKGKGVIWRTAMDQDQDALVDPPGRSFSTSWTGASGLDPYTWIESKWHIWHNPSKAVECGWSGPPSKIKRHFGKRCNLLGNLCAIKIHWKVMWIVRIAKIENQLLAWIECPCNERLFCLERFWLNLL